MVFLFVFAFFAVRLAIAEQCDVKIPEIQFVQNALLIPERLACENIPVGRQAVVNFDRSSSPTGVEHKYLLKRTGDREYSILYNLTFTLDSWTNDPQVSKEMRDRVSDCLRKHENDFVTPDGYTVKLGLLSEKEKEIYSEIESKISVSRIPVRRANSHFYSLKSSCESIWHELMHLSGLVDEYTETENTSLLKEPCRSVGPQDSLMNTHDFSFQTTNKSHRVILVRYCQCDPDDGCDKDLEKMIKKNGKCQGNYSEYSQSMDFYDVSDKDRFKESAILEQLSTFGMAKLNSKKWNERFLSSKSFPTVILELIDRTAPLYPAHFRSILYPLCYEKNDLYYRCARSAYKSKFKWIGKCPERPSECSNPALWLK